MSVFDRAKELAGRALDEGRERAEDLRRRRERARLMGELGEACYRQVKGDADAAAEIDGLAERIDDLEAAPTDEVSVDLAAAEESGETTESGSEAEDEEPATTP